ncbi:amino acid/amide ABC transporter ATP-binding protein 1, HAAT family [Palleronia pelagia]|uniref:Amino acid/amide ABC transporter ATP-binding protein 1, HAAT family n=2 Tax=Palleronia pelagia TaxID=387096 RepID=A0A1H8H9J8_9RHOB|nr:ABC transporter ATP-binding protein [Palleronia pelagia]SEN53001.1 amino acid/amide ABC transporter ATP-binding protein 1, HAAT family [Palleronia pelagia]
MSDAVLSTHGLRKSFGALLATDGVSLDLRPGEIHAVIGPNGAGKSTLIAQICGSLVPDAGQVRLDGIDVTAASPAQRARRGLARTFQVSALAMEDSVLENVTLGATGRAGGGYGLLRRALGRGDRHDRALAAIDRVGLGGVADMPAAALSHGQRRLLEVAIALSLAPRAFVMDEPMAGLGGEGSADLTLLLDALRTEAPILLVEHDMDAVFALADRISVLVAGRVIASGRVDEVRADRQVRRAYLGDL